MILVVVIFVIILLVCNVLLLELGLQVIESVILVDIVKICNDTSPTSSRTIVNIGMSSSTVITSRMITILG